MKRHEHFASPAGFTLIEIIATLMLSALLSGMIIAYFGTGLTESGRPVRRLQATFALSSVMEHITAEYEERKTDQNAETGQTLLSGLKNELDENQKDYIEDDGSIETHFVQFVDGVEEASSSDTNILKVTITNQDSASLTALFTQEQQDE